MSGLDRGTVQNVEGDPLVCIPSRRRGTILYGRRRKYVRWKVNLWMVSVFFVTPSSTQIESGGGEIVDQEEVDGERLQKHLRPQLRLQLLQQLQTLQRRPIVLAQYEPTGQAGVVVDGAGVLHNPG
jgi:hypothetical protein